MADDVKRFRDMLNECMTESAKKLNIKQIPEEKKANLLEKFKKAIG
jgi:hypothetical protein